ncbi:hypothetical protein BK004_04725 [bacterium CG10_46_32]|nr:MAG: hypothetical protein BK004_04725 [bacterium CG10_46_32]PIR55747.1 MAG: hypothetical protein COU73_04765 [Parcubacteria group bacterium CG10_big_fil_rev_8_21_14_0_10_46_32]
MLDQFQSLNSLKKDGFLGFKKIGDLFKNCSNIPQERGIYLVLYTEKHYPKFIDPGKGGFYKGKNPNVLTSKLESNWIDDAKVIYIGQAGGKTKKGKWSNQTLYGRIAMYMKFGKRCPVAHWGGRYIWQIKNYKNLTICWKSLPNKIKDPRRVEKEMIRDFKGIYNDKRPFANLQN